jgi:hypothetical protein
MASSPFTTLSQMYKTYKKRLGELPKGAVRQQGGGDGNGAEAYGGTAEAGGGAAAVLHAEGMERMAAELKAREVSCCCCRYCCGRCCWWLLLLLQAV